MGTTLATLRRGAAATIAALPADRGRQSKLLAFGILPGTRVRVLQTFPVYVLAFGHTKLAIDREIAKAIRVIKSDR